MDKDEFNRRVLPLLKFNKKLDRYVLIKPTETKPCRYCLEPVTNQTITAEVYRFGTSEQHFKHKCQTCKLFVYDGSSSTPHQLTKSKHLEYYTPKPNISVNGKRLGRPRKYIAQ